MIAAHLLANHAADRLAVFQGNRRLQEQPLVARQEFADPAAPDDRVTAPEEETIALAARLIEIVAARSEVEETQRQFVTPIVDVVEDRPIALGGVFRRED